MKPTLNHIIRHFTVFIILCIVSGMIFPNQAIAHDELIQDTRIFNVIEDLKLKEDAVNNIKNAGGSLKTHYVDRGETLESIAETYKIPVDFLKILNPGIKECYAGTELSIPVLPRSEQSYAQSSCKQHTAKNSIDHNISVKYIEAENAFKKHDYGKAVKIYGKIIKEKPSAEAYFNRGLAQFNREKWRQAAEDLDKARHYKGASTKIKEKCDELYKIANKNHEIWAQRRNQIIGGVIAGALVAGATTYATIEMSKSNNAASLYSPYYAYSGSVANSGVNMNAVSNQLMAKTIQDVSMQNMQYNTTFNALMNQTIQQAQFEKQNFITNFKTNNPLASDLDAEQAYTNYLSLKYGGTTLDINTTDNSIDYNKRKKDNLNRTYGEICKSCGGTGKCHACGGTKIASGMGQTYHCNICNDDGKCPVCHGTGKTSWNR